ncbi:MAG: hydantoinase/oxoprolinase family protein [Pigmentiphaga sp.]
MNEAVDPRSLDDTSSVRLPGKAATQAGGLIVGVDVGGTFTDMFALDQTTGSVQIVKVPSTRGDEARGFMTGLERAVPEIHEIRTIVHGTTVGTNALLERRVAKTGIITTRGFRDVLEMRRRDRPQTWGLRGAFEPIVPRALRLEVDERVLADGTLHTEVDLDQVRDQARALLAAGCEAVCLFFINAYANPENEKRAAEAVRSLWPNSHVTAATEVLPEIREFERCSTAALNAALQPVVGGYLAQLATGLETSGVEGEFLVVQSNGGVMSRQTAGDLPIRTALSGPAAGVIACAAIAEAAGYPDVVTGDMGGTSFDVSLVTNAQASLAAQTAIEFGMVVRSPMIQIETIGAGGGSLAWVDSGGMLQVGPQSAGSNPGPACYGRGNDRPTVTDANVVLGRILSDRPLGEGLLATLDRDKAFHAIESGVARPLGLDTLQAAEAILTVANAKMAGAIRLVSIERGHDPRQFAYMPFGGGGALHVCAIMREVGINVGIVPLYPGVTSALGCVMADMRHDVVQTLNIPLSRLDPGELQERLREIGATCQQRLDSAGIAFEAIQESIELDMLYAGQTHALSVSVGTQSETLPDIDGIRQAFETTYGNAYGRILDNIPIRVLNLRYARIGVRPKLDLALLAVQTDNHPALPVGTQRIYHEGRWWDTPRYERLGLPLDTRLEGPALLGQPDTTIWLEPGFQARVDRCGNLLISRQ